MVESSKLSIIMRSDQASYLTTKELKGLGINWLWE